MFEFFVFCQSSEDWLVYELEGKDRKDLSFIFFVCNFLTIIVLADIFIISVLVVDVPSNRLCADWRASVRTGKAKGAKSK